MTNKIVVPVYSQSYATAASTTGTKIGAPKASVKPLTDTVLPVDRIMAACVPTTGESAWLSNSVVDSSRESIDDIAATR